MNIVPPSVTLLWITQGPEKQIEMAVRTCYKSEAKMTDDSAGEFCRRMVKSGHHAMIEHAIASFRIITDRGISHEIVRHRIASYAQESTRYCNYKTSGCTFIEPSGLTEAQRVVWRNSCEAAEQDYLKLLYLNASPQIARSVLPTCLKTEIIMTANFREWRHFIKLRSSTAAHPQIRPIANSIHEILCCYAPNIFKGE